MGYCDQDPRPRFQAQKFGILIFQYLRKPHEIDIKQVAICIAMGIFIYSYGYLLPGIARISFKCIGLLMVLHLLAAQQEEEDSERKSHSSKTRRSKHHNAVKSISNASEETVRNQTLEKTAGLSKGSRVPVVSENSRVSRVLSNEEWSAKEVELLNKQLAKNPPGKPGRWEAIQVQTSRMPIFQYLRKLDEDDIQHIAICIAMGIVIYSYGHLLPGIWRILFRCFGLLMVLRPLVAQQEDSERKSHSSTTRRSEHQNAVKSQVQKSRIPISQNLRKPDEIDLKEVAICITPGIVVYSYGYILAGTWQILFKWIGILMLLYTLVPFYVTRGDKNQLAKNAFGKPGRWEAIAEAFDGCTSVECVIKKAKSLREKKPVDEVLDRPVLQEPDKTPMLEEEMGWSDAEDTNMLLEKILLFFLQAIEK